MSFKKIINDREEYKELENTIYVIYQQQSKFSILVSSYDNEEALIAFVDGLEAIGAKFLVDMNKETIHKFHCGEMITIFKGISIQKKLYSEDPDTKIRKFFTQIPFFG